MYVMREFGDLSACIEIHVVFRFTFFSIIFDVGCQSRVPYLTRVSWRKVALVKFPATLLDLLIFMLASHRLVRLTRRQTRNVDLREATEIPNT